MGAGLNWLHDFVIRVDEERHRASVASSRLDLPLLPPEVALLEKRRSLSWGVDVQFCKQDVLDEDSTDVLHEFLAIHLDLFVQAKLLFSLKFCFLDVLLAHRIHLHLFVGTFAN